MERPSIARIASTSLFCLLAQVAPAAACSIAGPPPSTLETRDASYATFEGRILSLASTVGAVEARVQVLRRWKGPDVAELSVWTAPTGAQCGYGDAWKVGDTWLLFTQRDGCQQLGTGLFQQSSRIGDAAAQLAALGPPLPAGVEVHDGGVTDGGYLLDAGSPSECADMSVAPDMAAPGGAADLSMARDLAVLPLIGGGGCALGGGLRRSDALFVTALLAALVPLLRRRRPGPRQPEFPR